MEMVSFTGCLINVCDRELERRKQEGEYAPKITEESTSNYQRKILPWEQIEVGSFLGC